MTQPDPAVPEVEEVQRGRHGLRRIRAADDNYGLVLISILVTLIVLGVVSQRAAGGLIVPVLFLGIFFLTMITSGVSRRTILLLLIVVPFVLGIGAAATTASVGSGLSTMASVVSALLVIACVFFIFRRLAQHVVISRRTIFGALCVYLFIALLFALVYAIIAVWSGQPFFTQVDNPPEVDYIYFSFIAMTTVGFGDLTPATDMGRMTVIVEAILGQLYLVVVVALFVSRIGHRRMEPTEKL